MKIRIPRQALTPAVLSLLACSASGEGAVADAAGVDSRAMAPPPCRVAQPPRALPGELREASGVVVSPSVPGLLWLHNDSGSDPELFELDAEGVLRGRVRVDGAKNRDWEDLAAGPCAPGTDGQCLYIADIGDNDAERQDAVVYRVPEPEPGVTRSGPADAFPIRYPDGPRDAEALFVLPPDNLFVVTKGSDGPIEVYRYPPPLLPGERVELQRVRSLSAGAVPADDQVTGADATPDGSRVLLRTHHALLFYPTPVLLEGQAGEATRVDLTPLSEPQGEGVALGPRGSVVLVGEGVSHGYPGDLVILWCAALEPGA